MRFAARGQSTIEYLIITSIFIFLLAISYSASNGMAERREAIEAHVEGERVASYVARNIDAISRTGDGASSYLLVHAFPEQTVLVSGNEVASFGPRNMSIAIAPLSGAMVNKTSYGETVIFQTTQSIKISRVNGVIYVEPLG